MELIRQAKKEMRKENRSCNLEREFFIAEYLIANGVILPPCKVGDDIYWIERETNKVRCEKNSIMAVCYYGSNEFKIITDEDSLPEDIGTDYSFLSKEEAEKALKECT